MRPLAVVLLTAAFGGVLGFVGLREFRRRRRHNPSRPAVPNPSSSIEDENERAVSEVVPVRRRLPANLRIRPGVELSSMRILFEFLMLLISLLLAWIMSPADSTFLVLFHMTVIWLSLRSIGVSLPPDRQLEDNDLNSDNSSAVVPTIEDKSNIDGDRASWDPVMFLGRPPPSSSDSYQWVGPLDANVEFDIYSAVQRYWTFFGSEHMPKLTANIVNCKASRSGEHLVHRSIRLQLNLPYFIKAALGGVSDVEIHERSVWDPKMLSFRVHSCNSSSRGFVTVMDIFEIRRDHSNPDWVYMTRRVCFQVSESVGMLRGSLQSLIRTMILKKAEEFIVQFQHHLENGPVCLDPNNVTPSA